MAGDGVAASGRRPLYALVGNLFVLSPRSSLKALFARSDKMKIAASRVPACARNGDLANCGKANGMAPRAESIFIAP